MYPISSTIEDAKQLLLNFDEINGKIFTISELAGRFSIGRKEFIELHNIGLVKLDKFILKYTYIEAFRNKRKETLSQLARQRLASIGSGRLPMAEKLKGYYDDKFCGLTENIFHSLKVKLEASVTFEDMVNFKEESINPLSYCTFKVSIEKAGLEIYLNDFIKKYQNDEVDDSSSHRYLSYQAQKESVTSAIKRLITEGQPANSLKIDYTQIWADKYEVLRVHFVETFLAMEKEGLFEILSISYTPHPHSIFITSDDFWNYPKIIKVKLADKFLTPGCKRNFPSNGVYFDESDGILSYNGQSAQLVKIGSKEHFLLKTLFDVNKLGEWLNEQDIEESYSRGDVKNFRWIKDVILRLNKKIESKLSIKVFFERGGSKIRINPNYLS